uniref:Uncharacterized protein n=1 Tax=Octopus bimaculoides TaxID=37653 RepID=A0A0L8FLM6_OCTBM
MYIRKYGNVSFFITMTCNPNWPEMRQNLFLNQKPHDKPDLIARVFDLKRKLFIKYHTGVDGLFGKYIAYVITVEYQKRGLPRVHCLLWLNEASKPRSQKYDKFVQAEIPDPNKNPEGHKLKHVIHVPIALTIRHVGNMEHAASAAMEECIDFIYPSFDNPGEVFANNCTLAPLNQMMRSINSSSIRHFPVIIKGYRSYNSVSDDASAVHFPTEFLDSVELSGMRSHKLELRKGSPIFLMRNLNLPRLSYGTHMEELLDNLIVTRINTATFRNEIVMIPRITINLSEGEDIPLQRSQFPVQS